MDPSDAFMIDMDDNSVSDYEELMDDELAMHRSRERFREEREKYRMMKIRSKRKGRDKEARELWEHYKGRFKRYDNVSEKYENLKNIPVTKIKVNGEDIEIRQLGYGHPWYIDQENKDKLQNLYPPEVISNIFLYESDDYPCDLIFDKKDYWFPLIGLPATYLPNINVVEHRTDVPGYEYVTLLHDSNRNYTWTYQMSTEERAKSFNGTGPLDTFTIDHQNKSIKILKDAIPINDEDVNVYKPKDYFNIPQDPTLYYPRKTLDTGIFRQPKLDDMLEKKFANLTLPGYPPDEDTNKAPYGYYRDYQNFWQTAEVKVNEEGVNVRYRKIGNSDLVASELCLGTMTFGNSCNGENSLKLLNYAFDKLSINFFDTAEIYPLPIMRDTYGLTEKIMGLWLKKRGKDFREKIVLATKIAGRNRELDWLRDGKFTSDSIIQAVEGSLERLGTDYIDLLQFHWPDRYVPMQETGDHNQVTFDVNSMGDVSSTMEEQVEAIGKLIKDGKIRYWGLSNETPWGVLRFWQLTQELGIQPPVSVQLNYNLLCRNDVEKGFIEMARPQNTGIGLLAYGPLAGGILTGKYLEYMDATTSGRLLKYPSYMKRYRGSLAAQSVKEYNEIAMEFHLPNLSVMALRWVYTRPFICSTIIGVNDAYQLRENVHCLNDELPMTDLMERRINQMHWKWRDPIRIIQ